MSSDLQPEIAPELIQSLRAAVTAARAQNAQDWAAHRSPWAQQKRLAKAIDGCIRTLWQSADIPKASLLAVGGYGRGELAPYSDIDLLVLLHEPSVEEEQQARISAFLAALWDIGLDAGHSVRSLEDCMAQAQADQTIATALLEHRLLAGTPARAQALHQAWFREIDRRSYVQAKLLEMRQRHARYQDTPFALEPNVKESPGGLRDLQVLQWVAKAYGLSGSWMSLADRGLITPREAGRLRREQGKLLSLRAQLHLAAGRREDRLVFDLQGPVAERYGLKAATGRRTSELLMQRYYQTAKAVSQLSRMLLANFEPVLFPASDQEPIRVIDEHYAESRGLLDIRDEQLFAREPREILKVFLVMGRESSRLGLTARTTRALWHQRHLVNEAFRRDPGNRQTFLALLQQPRGMVHSLRLMNDLGLLGRMLPVFRRIVGQMQHDLFHIYTVDQHILQVLRNLRRLSMPEHVHEFPLLSELMHSFDGCWKLYLAALFHDVAKGRGGDHSQLGEVEARRFCKAYGLDAQTQDLLCFLVAEHLTMSAVAQKQDISDPEVVAAFAARMRTPERLTALYLLTVCDIRGTSPKVWNHWKGSLLEDLYRRSLRHLQAQQAGNTGLETLALAKDQERQDAERILLLHTRDLDQAHQFWRQFDYGYFLQHKAIDLAWHARMLSHRAQQDAPIVCARMPSQGEGLKVLVYQRDTPALFARITAYFDRKGLPILDARLQATRDGHVLDTFVLDHRNCEGQAREMTSIIEAELTELLLQNQPLPSKQPGRASRQSRQFPIQPTVEIHPDQTGRFHNLAITAIDRPSLLYSIARLLAEAGVAVRSARIATLGERVEDRFLVSGPELDTERGRLTLEAKLLELIEV